MARPSNKKDIKERVMLAALELIAEGGFQQSPMSKLAKVAGVSVGSIYLYFPSKDELIAALFEDIRWQMQDAILAEYDENASVRKRFETLFLNTCRYYLDNKTHFIFMDQFLLSGYNKSGLDAFSEKAANAFLGTYEDGVKTGILKPIELQVSLSLTHGPIISFVKRHHTGGVTASPAMLHQLVNGAWDAVSA